MALEAGELHFTLEYARNLKDEDWFGRQDPYCVVKCGGQSYRSRTQVDGGKNPVFAETFRFNIINENTVEVTVYDEDTLVRDDLIGLATVSLASVRYQGHDSQHVPVISRKKGKQHGELVVTLKFIPNRALAAGHPGSYALPHAATMPAYMPPGYPPAPMPAPAPYYAPPPAGPVYAAPPPMYAAPAPYPPPAPAVAYPPAPAMPPAYGQSYSYSYPAQPPVAYPPAAASPYSYTAGAPPPYPYAAAPYGQPGYMPPMRSVT